MPVNSPPPNSLGFDSNSNSYLRYDYEGVSSQGADNMMAHLLSLAKKHPKGDKLGHFVVEHIDEFEYKDPVDGSVSSRQVNPIMCMLHT